MSSRGGGGGGGGRGVARILHWAVIDGGNNGRVGAGGCASRVAPMLNSYLEHVRGDAGETVIEQQLPGSARKFHYMAHELHGMALGAGCGTVRFQFAKVKEQAVPSGRTAEATTYEQRKAGAIDDTTRWLASNDAEQHHRDWFAALEKQDDAADALLHAVVALRKSAKTVRRVLAIDVGMANIGICVLEKKSLSAKMNEM